MLWEEPRSGIGDDIVGHSDVDGGLGIGIEVEHLLASQRPRIVVILRHCASLIDGWCDDV